MNCIFLLLLLSCCGGFGGENRSDGNYGCSSNNGQGRGNNSPRGNGNHTCNNDFPSVGNNCGCQEATPFSNNDGNPSNWQDYPEISRRENCDSCEQ